MIGKVDAAYDYCTQRSLTMRGVGRKWLQCAIMWRDDETILDVMVTWFHREWRRGKWRECRHTQVWRQFDDGQRYVVCTKCERVLLTEIRDELAKRTR